ncbi:hypothetical protein D8S78_20800 [Natrialba swarupiae]|nr:hypothetical protein [Natrialba swarupiae]
MLPVADRPLVAHTVDAAIDAGADEIILVIGYKGETIREYFGSSYRGCPLPTACNPNRSERRMPSQPHATISRAFAVLNGDNVYEPAAIERLFDRCPAVCAIEVDDPRNYGVLSTADGTVTDIVESHLTRRRILQTPARTRFRLQLATGSRCRRATAANAN